MITGDAAYIKRINRSLIIKEIINSGMISRAELAKAVDLTRATISVQVADLMEENLLIETHLEHNAVGRKPIMLSLQAEAGYAIGIDVDRYHITFLVTDLLGKNLTTDVVPIQTTQYAHILSILINQLKQYEQRFNDSYYGIVGVVIAIHGLVSNNERIVYIPHLDWHHVALKDDIAAHINVPVYIENNANLTALAERVYTHHNTDNLLSMTFYSGIGLGLILNGKFYKGHDGYAGETGHMIIMPDGLPCKCGNKGCWEKYASDTTILEQIAHIKQLPSVNTEQIGQWLAEGDSEVLHIVDRFFYYVSIGLNNIINIYNPDVVVIDSGILHLFPDASTRITSQLHSKISHYRELSISKLGKKSCVLGASALAIQYFLDLQDINLPIQGE